MSKAFPSNNRMRSCAGRPPAFRLTGHALETSAAEVLGVPLYSVRGLALGFGLCCAVLPRSAPAEARPQVELVYATPHRCAPRAGLVREVTSHLGRNPFTPGAARQLHVSIHEQPPDYEAQIQVLDNRGRIHGTRTVSSRSCETLREGVVFGVVLLLDAAPVTRASKAKHPTRPETKAGVPKPEARANPRSQTELEGGASISSGLLPYPAVEFTVGLHQRFRHFSMGIEVDASLPDDSVSGSTVQVRTALLGGSLVPCWTFGRWSTCVPVSLGRFSSEGRAQTAGARQSSVWSAIGARAAYHIPLGARTWTAVRAGLRVPLTETRVSQNGQALWTSAPLVVGGGLVLGVKIQ